MQQHGPSDFTGPLRGTSAWWQTPTGQSETTEPTESGGQGATGLRQDLIERVRREIAAGTYDTAEKWHAALDRMLEQLD